MVDHIIGQTIIRGEDIQANTVEASHTTTERTKPNVVVAVFHNG
ncbi:hypothetical protein SDC9_90772 [bioreactor metagenome]|uniref:Uncharacterized protein n=1 Tax=bioreactor metagenome TaxID=1076179 RepID=A0A645A2R3_9ZZZZ